MKIYNKLTSLILAGTLAVSAVGFSSCNDDDEFSTQQYATEGVHLNVFGPSPVARGGELRFLGTGMNQITSIEIPGCDPISDIKIISNEEIRVTVPQTALPGKVKLNWAQGAITTKTQLSYTEPISIESFSPATVKPGQELTIKGEYLNLIHEVIFADEVVVPEEEFTKHSRSEIALIVPEEAKTGKFIISDGKEIPNWIYSETELVVTLPSVKAPLDLTAAKPGDVVAVEGLNLDLVKDVLMPNGDSVEFEVENGAIRFTLPRNISDGTIVMIPASGVKVAIANIGVVVPTELVAEPAEGLRADTELVIKGVNMQMVATISFPNIKEAVEPASVSATEVRVAWPAMAQSGNVVLNLTSGKFVEIEVQTAKPQVTGFKPNPVAAAAKFLISGKNLDLVKKITFGGGIEVEIENDNKSRFEVVAPATAQSGPLKLTMANGEVVETEELTIEAPQCAFIAEVLSEELLGGELMIVKVVNGDKLTDVLVGGSSVQYIINGEKLYISLPQTAGKGTVVTLVSSNGEISYTYDVIPATHIENVIWSGAWECAGWAGNQDLAYGAFDWSTVPAGAKLTVYLTSTVPADQWWCISFRHGDSWGNLPGNVGSQIDMPNDGFVEITLTQDIIDDLVANMGLIITGQDYIMTKITLSWEISLEQTLWEGELIADNWSDQPYALSDAGLELAAAGAKPGQTVYFYITPLADYFKLEILEGHWGPSYGAWTTPGQDTESGKFTEWDLGANGGKVGIVLTQEMLDAAYTQQWWGGTFVLNGDKTKVTKITIL